jgi:hypothetical protein
MGPANVGATRAAAVRQGTVGTRALMAALVVEVRVAHVVKAETTAADMKAQVKQVEIQGAPKVASWVHQRRRTL